MMDQNHITNEELAAYAVEDLESAEISRIEDHLGQCPDCTGRLQSVRQFVADLDHAWNRDRLRAMGVTHPSVAELEALWLDESGERDMESIRRHVEGCEPCRAHLRRLEEGYSTLMTLDPLNRPAWSDLVRQKFAAGIEVVVEAASGAYTSAAGMMRDVMTPQARAQLVPAQAMAMGGHRGSDSVSWSDANFLTDELSGEITGSTDPNTGRGIITVVINKTGAYVAAAPIIDLVNEKGRPVATQFALDLGDRYSAHFNDLDQGRYLVGIREPGE